MIQTGAKQGLVVVRSGSRSLHSRWIRSQDSCPWHYIISDYESSLTQEVQASSHCFVGPKLAGLLHLFRGSPEIVNSYRYFFFPDDDLDMTASDVSRLFEVMEAYDLALAQPSLNASSFISRAVTLNNPHTLLRFINWIESMAPCFSRAALVECLWTFGLNTTGWGVETLWAQVLQGQRIALIDAIQVCHTRPYGGPNHAYAERSGTTALCELIALFGRYQARQPSLRLSGVILPDGRELSLKEQTFDPMDDRWLCSPW